MIRKNTLFLLLILPMLAYGSSQQAKIDSAYLKALGDFYFRRNEISKALKSYQRALRSDPNNIECHYKLGEIYLKQELYNFAANKFKIVINKRDHLRNKGLLLDSWITLSHLFFLKGKTLIGKTRRNIYFVFMKMYLEKTLNSFKKGEYFQRNLTKFKINRDYYLSKTYYILGRYYRDQNRPSHYVTNFKLAIDHYNRLKPIKNKQDNVIFRLIDSHYILWEYYLSKKNKEQATKHNNAINKIIATQQKKIRSKSDAVDIKRYKKLLAYTLKVKKNGINSIFNFLPNRKK